MLIHSFKKIPDTFNVPGTGTLAKQCHIRHVTVTAVACDIRNVTVTLFPPRNPGIIFCHFCVPPPVGIPWLLVLKKEGIPQATERLVHTHRRRARSLGVYFPSSSLIGVGIAQPRAPASRGAMLGVVYSEELPTGPGWSHPPGRSPRTGLCLVPSP